jgi:hypothetical protein
VSISWRNVTRGEEEACYLLAIHNPRMPWADVGEHIFPAHRRTNAGETSDDAGLALQASSAASRYASRHPDKPWPLGRAQG